MKSLNQSVAIVFLISLSICSAAWTRCSGSIADDNNTENCCIRDTVQGVIKNEKLRLNTWCDVGKKDTKQADGFSKHYHFTGCCEKKGAGLTWTDMFDLPDVSDIGIIY